MKNSTKVLALLLSLIMMLSVATIGSFAAEATTSTWDGVAVSTSLTGTGTADDPYLISSAADLKYLADKVNDGTLNTDGKYFKQTVDIDLANKPWTPIGNDQKTVGEGEAAAKVSFKGIYDGNLKTIKGLKSDDACAAVEITTTPAEGETTADGTAATPTTETKYGGVALFGFTQPPTDGNVIIKNLALFGAVSIENAVNAAGLIAVSESAEISNCYVDVDVTAKGNGKYAAGYVANPTMALIIENCVNAGDTTVTDATTAVRAGNFVGYARGGNNGLTPRNMINCYGLGNVSVSVNGDNNNIRAGGITGGLYNGVMMKSVHFYGTFTYTNATDAAVNARVGYFAGGVGYNAANTLLGANMVVGCTTVVPAGVVEPTVLGAITAEGAMALIGGGSGLSNPDVTVATEPAPVPYKVANMFLVEVVVEEETTEEPTTEEETTVEPEDDDETTGKTETNAPETNAPTTNKADDANKGGCASVVGGLSVIAIVAGAALVLAKKKD